VIFIVYYIYEVFQYVLIGNNVSLVVQILCDVMPLLLMM